MLDQSVFAKGLGLLAMSRNKSLTDEILKTYYAVLCDRIGNYEFERAIEALIRRKVFQGNLNELPTPSDILCALEISDKGNEIQELRKRMGKFLAFEGELFLHLTSSNPRPKISPENLALLDALGGGEKCWRILKRKDLEDSDYRGNMPWDEFKAKMIGSVDWHLLQDRLTGQISAIEHQKQICGGAESLAFSVKRLR